MLILEKGDVVENYLLVFAARNFLLEKNCDKPRPARSIIFTVWTVRLLAPGPERVATLGETVRKVPSWLR